MIRLLIGIGVVATSVGLYIRYGDLLTLESLKRNQRAIHLRIEAQPVVAGLCYVLVMVCVIGLTCPGATMLSLSGGVLFPQPYASFLAYTGFVIGATVSYAMVTFVLRDMMRERLAASSSLYKRFEANMQDNAFFYLVAARYCFVFPFWFVNAASALVGVNLITFMAASSLSCIPGAVVYTSAGGVLSGILEKVTDTGEINTKDLIYTAMTEPRVAYLLLSIAAVLVILVFLQRAQARMEKAKAGKSS